MMMNDAEAIKRSRPFCVHQSLEGNVPATFSFHFISWVCLYIASRARLRDLDTIGIGVRGQEPRYIYGYIFRKARSWDAYPCVL